MYFLFEAILCLRLLYGLVLLRLPSLISSHTSCVAVLCCCRHFSLWWSGRLQFLVWFREFLTVSDGQGDLLSVGTSKCTVYCTVNHSRSRSALEEMTVALGRAGHWRIFMRVVVELSCWPQKFSYCTHQPLPVSQPQIYCRGFVHRGTS